MGFLCFLKKTTKTCFIKKYGFKKTQEFFLKKGFFSTVTIFQSYFEIFPWLHDLEQVTSLLA